MDIVSKVSGYVRSLRLPDGGGRMLVALSGGADSVALLLLMRRLGYAVEAVHCNFHLRGNESDRDELFVRNLCERLGVGLHIAHFDTREYAALHRESIETAARNLRYDYFERLRRDIGADYICVAHHRDDSVETLLMNAMRGTGVRGLSGIRPLNGRILRPLLCLSRQEIEAFLRQEGEGFVTDSTNLEDDATRNRVRHSIIPVLREFSPSAVDGLQRTAENIADTLPLLDWALKECRPRISSRQGLHLYIYIRELLSMPSPKFLLLGLLQEEGLSVGLVEEVFAAITAKEGGGETGRMFQNDEKTVLIDRGRIVVEPRQEDFKPKNIPETGRYVLTINGEERSLTLKTVKTGEGFAVSRKPETATFDASKVRFPLKLRTAGQGDRFAPFGMKGTKLVSDYLTDQKLSLTEKRRQLVLTDADGEILWVVGRRASDLFRLTDKSSEALVIHFDRMT